MYFLEGRGLGEAPSCNTTNCSAVSVDRFDKQPAEFQRVLAKSSRDPAGWFGKLDSRSRFALTAIFNRMCRYRLWCHVDIVLKIVAAPGSQPSVHFLSPSGKALLQALMATGRFCVARGIGASLHPGQTSLREVSGSDSLHISIGPGNQFDAHIDLYSPVPEHPGSSFCPNHPSVAATRHIGREAVTEILQKKTRIPGIQVFPHFDPTPTVPRPAPATRQEADLPPPPVGITWRF